MSLVRQHKHHIILPLYFTTELQYHIQKNDPLKVFS